MPSIGIHYTKQSGRRRNDSATLHQVLTTKACAEMLAALRRLRDREAAMVIIASERLATL
jgi:hypothetical protein